MKLSNLEKETIILWNEGGGSLYLQPGLTATAPRLVRPVPGAGAFDQRGSPWEHHDPAPQEVAARGAAPCPLPGPAGGTGENERQALGHGCRRWAAMIQ